MIIDIHTHAFPDALAARAIPAMAAEAGIPARADGTIAGLKRAIERGGANIGVLQPVATRPNQSRKINEWVVSVQSDTIRAFGSVHPGDDDVDGILQYLQDHGIPGVKLHPDYQGFMADDPSVFPLYEKLFARGMAVLFHAGVDIGIPDPVHCTPPMLLTIIRHFPEATVIAAHFGGYLYWDAVEELLIGTPLYLDTAYTLPDLSPQRMVDMARRHGVDRVLFGTDSPWRDIGEEIASIRKAGFSEGELDKILWQNASGILRLPAV